jgi:small subunit ribosomal protein S21
VQVFVRDNNVDQALRALKKKMQREGVFREMKLRKHYEKPSENRVPEKAEAGRRARKLARKKVATRGSATDEASGEPRDWRQNFQGTFLRSSLHRTASLAAPSPNPSKSTLGQTLSRERRLSSR